MWTKLFLLLGPALFLVVNVAGQCLEETYPPNPPCGIGTSNLSLTQTAPLSGLCCSIDNKQGSVSTIICTQEVLVCYQGYFVPRQNLAIQLNGYSAQLTNVLGPIGCWHRRRQSVL